jgi:hypothetical protein
VRARSRSETDNYLFLGSITPKVPTKEEKATKEHGRHEAVANHFNFQNRYSRNPRAGKFSVLALACAFKVAAQTARETFPAVLRVTCVTSSAPQ